MGGEMGKWAREEGGGGRQSADPMSSPALIVYVKHAHPVSEKTRLDTWLGLGLSSTLTWEDKKADFPAISKRGEKYPKMFWGALGVPI